MSRRLKKDVLRYLQAQSIRYTERCYLSDGHARFSIGIRKHFRSRLFPGTSLQLWPERVLEQGVLVGCVLARGVPTMHLTC